MPTTIRDAAGNLVQVATTDDLIEMVATEAGQTAIAQGVAALVEAQPEDPATNASLVALLNATATRDHLGNVIQPANYPHTITYNGDGTIATEFFAAGGFTYTKTFSWVSGRLTGESGWVRA